MEGIPETARDRADEGVGMAIEAANSLGGPEGSLLADAATGAFMRGFGLTLTAGVALFAATIVIVRRFFPA